VKAHDTGVINPIKEMDIKTQQIKEDV